MTSLDPDVRVFDGQASIAATATELMKLLNRQVGELGARTIAQEAILGLALKGLYLEGLAAGLQAGATGVSDPEDQ